MATGNLAESLSQMRKIEGDAAGKVSSLSGHERNPFFFNRQGSRFDDLSLISGADSDRDGRAVALWDYDRNGFLDLVVVNANAPRLAIYRNQLSPQLPGHHFVFLRFQGANSSNRQDVTKSNRDGYGCIVRADVAGMSLRAEHQCGAGFAAQNSAWMHLGIGPAEKIDHLTIRWPSGTVQTLADIPTGSLISCQELAEPNISSYTSP
jgi:hypothetical protein